MTRIFEFLLNNIFIVVIIVGFLASLFRKAGAAKKQPGRMPDFGGGGILRRQAPDSDSGTRSDEPRTAQTEYAPIYRSQDSQPARTSESRTIRQESGKEEPPASGITAMERSLQRAAAQKAKAGSAAASGHGSKSPAAEKVSSDDLRKAVIWAEVLGPPRAKRPYRK